MTVNRQHLDFLAAHRNGVLVTLKRDGRPQLSNIIYHYDAGTARVQISVTADRAKTRNAARDPRVSLHVSATDFWSWVVVEGEASLSEVAAASADATVETLVALYRALSGEHRDWDEFRAAMVSERRQVLTVGLTHAYGQLPS